MAARGVSFEGIGFTGLVSFKSALVKGTDEDKLVKVSANDTVALCAENDPFIGVVRVIDAFDGLAGVQIDGFVTMDFDPAHDDPALNFDSFVGGVTANLVKQLDAVAGANAHRVVNMDAANHKVTFEL
jgi:hypothetical protein